MQAPPAGLLDAIPGAQTLLLLFDPGHFEITRFNAAAPLPAARAQRTLRFPTLYDGADLDGFAVPRDQVVKLHAGATWTVAFLGFAPGFAYLRGAPRELAVPRLPTPRVRVPAGSVAVANGYSGIYPDESPGGWRLLGRVAQRLFDPARTPPALLQPGDRVIFEPVPALPALAVAPERAPEGAPVLRVLSPGPFTSVQGAPRHGTGAAAGGAMDLPALAAANAKVGNAPGAAGLEFTLAGPTLEALEDVRLSTGGALRAGERVALGPVRGGVRDYLAVEGGLWQPGVLTRPLRRGEVLHRGPSPGTASGTTSSGTSSTASGSRSGTASGPASGPASGKEPGPAASRGPAPRAFSGLLRAMPGPQLDYFAESALETFFGSEYHVSPHSDRRGLRLLGPALQLTRAADLPPEGTAPGAVQVPGDGLPIVLGPDRPLTGGYPKIATVISADLPLLAQARPGAALRFVRVTLEEALAARRLR